MSGNQFAVSSSSGGTPRQVLQLVQGDGKKFDM